MRRLLEPVVAKLRHRVWPGWASRQLLPLLILLALPSLMFPGAIPGDEVVSADDHLSVHHAFQSTAGGEVANPALSDPALQFKALRRRVTEALCAGDAPLWNPDLFAGAPLLADAQSMAGSPITWVRCLLPEDTAQDVGVWWTLVWGGLGTYLLLLAMGANPLGALLGGVGVATGPYVSVWLLHPHAATFVWLPWTLLGVEQLRRGRSGIWLALAVAGLVGGGHPGTLFHGLLITTAWALLRASCLTSLLGLGSGLLISAPLWLPALDFAGRSATLAVHGGETLAPAALLDILWPNYWGHPAVGGHHGPGAWADGVIHPGWGLLLAIVLVRRDARVWWLVGAWGLCLLLAMVGLPGPFNDTRLASIGTLFLALGAGLGVGRLRRRWMAWGLIAGTLFSGLWARWADQRGIPSSAHDPSPALWTQQLKDRVGEGRVIGLDWALQPNTGALAGLADLRGYDLPVSRDWIRLARALDPRVIRPWFPVQRLTVINQRLMGFAAVRFVLSPEPLEGRAPIVFDAAPLFVYPLAPEAPRAWFASRVRPVLDPQTSLEWVLKDPQARARPPVEGWTGWVGDGTEATGRAFYRAERSSRIINLAERTGGVSSLTEGTGAEGAIPIPMSREGNGRLLLRLPTHSDGIVVLADAWAPGWRAWEDGVPVPVLRVGGYFRGVPVVAGSRHVRMSYRPRAFTWGCGGMGLGGILLALLWWRARGRALQVSGRRAS